MPVVGLIRGWGCLWLSQLQEQVVTARPAYASLLGLTGLLSLLYAYMDLPVD